MAGLDPTKKRSSGFFKSVFGGAGKDGRLDENVSQSGTPHSTASAQNGGDFPAEQGSTLQSQNSGADDIAPKTRSPEKEASLDGAAMERTAAASQNSTLAAALAEANAQSSEATPAHVSAGAQQVATQDNNESAYRNSWQYAAEMTRKAEMEAQMAELKSQEAYKWATEAANAQREAEEAHARYDRAKARLRALEEEKAQIADKATALDRSQQSITAKEADVNVLQREAEDAAAIARTRYDEAKQQREVAEAKNQSFKQLEQQHLSTLDKQKEVEAQLQALSLEHQEHNERLEKGRGLVQARNMTVGEAQQLVERKRQELAEAEAVLESRQQELAAAVKQAHEHEEALNAKTEERDTHEQTVASTRSQVTSLHEQRDVAAQEAAAAQALIRDKADAAKVERERALQQKARVDQALTELDQQRAAHMKQDSELQEARAVAEKNAANIQPVRDEANFNARQANAKYAEAQEKSEAWLKAKGEAQEHKGRWSEYWNQAKQAGDLGDSESSNKFKSLEDKLAEVTLWYLIASWQGSCPAGGRYEGDFKEGKESGRGVKTWANGNKYDGEYKDGKKHGRGVFTWTEEGRVGPYLRYATVCMPPMRVASYEGEYKYGTMDGRCVFYGVDGRVLLFACAHTCVQVGRALTIFDAKNELPSAYLGTFVRPRCFLSKVVIANIRRH
eukprot:jgi/Astpho2/7097/Aster-01926